MLFKKGEWVEAIETEWDSFTKKPCCFRGERGYVVKDQEFENQLVLVCFKTKSKRYGMLDRYVSAKNLKRISGPYDGLDFDPEKIREMERESREKMPY